ncbi:MAG: D-aminoacyl-tRNA deacylase [Candidatus Omnitrophica bacterium]|nr:D-aminoacyl-tRNA deacylase [Candidatus Omnitrophota bacterium]
MKLVIQRVKEARVTVDSKTVGQIGPGILVFVGVAKEDSVADVEYLVSKLVELRIFEDDQGKMNRSALDLGAQFLVVSQFTLLGDCSQGRRPSFDRAAQPGHAEELYHEFVNQLRAYPIKVETGQFRAMMDVALINDGPVTFILESSRNAH